MSQHHALLLLGSNLGDTKKNIEDAITLIDKKLGSIHKKSSFLITAPVEFVSCNYFCNIALSIHTSLSPMALLREIKNIEKVLGRLRDSYVVGHYTDRIIDIDIVEFGSIFFKSKKLNIPHMKHKFERDFSRQLIQEVTN